MSKDYAKMFNDKILIGTPIRDFKEYGIRRWLESVKALDYPNRFLFMVDNSDREDFSKYIEEHCQKIGLRNYKLLHLEDMGGRENEARLVLSHEKIREKLLMGDYKYWFSWECDILLPSDILNVLLDFTNQFDIVSHCYPDKENKNMEVGGIGCSLFKRELLERFSFIENGGYAQCDPLEPNCYYGGDSWLMRRILRAGYKIIDIHNLLDVKHLGQID